MGWHQDVNMDTVIAEAAPYGGPIAVRRDEHKFVKVKGTGTPIIAIYSGSGKQITSIKVTYFPLLRFLLRNIPLFQWTRRPIIKMCWTNSEKLICIQDDGQIIVHDLFGIFLQAFTLCQEAQDTKIIDTKIYTSPQNVTGIAILTSSFKIFVFNNILEPKKRQLSDLPSKFLF